MANLSENPQWVDGIYQIETSDPVVGGPEGVSNRQAKELASRTSYLKKEQEKTGSDLATHAAAADPHTQYAPKANPTFTGTPKAPTPATDSNSQQVATTAFVKSVAAALVNGAPAALDTLQELAKAIGNDPNFSATVLNAITAAKVEVTNKLGEHAAAADPHTQYAPKANPTFTGTPKAPTPATDSNSQQVATTAFVKSVAAALVNGAPAALDTLQELAKAVGNDPNFSTTVLNELAKKVPLSGGTLTGELLLSTANALRLIYGDYGVILRNDGNRFYLLLTNKGDKTGNYSALRPFDINFATGDMTIGHDLNVVGAMKEKGQRVYSPNNKPTATEVGALATGGTAAAATKLATARTINGVAFDGTANIALTPANIGALPAAGTAAAATKLAVARKIAGVAFDGTADIDVNTQGIFSTSLSIGNAVDLNAYTTPGLYHQAANVQAASGKNYPEAQAGSLEVLKHAGITQVYRIYNNSRCYKRTHYSGAWSAWVLDYDAANKPTAADIGAITKTDADNNYVRKGSSGVVSKNDDLAWNSPTGAYLKDNGGDSSLIWHIGLNTGSTSAAQFHFNYANGGLKYRSSRDSKGFEKPWARIYTDQDKPTTAEIGALPVAGTAVAATKLATPRKINGVVFDGTADINIASRWNKVASGSVSYPLVNSQTKSFVGTIDTGVATTSWVHDSKKYAVVLSSKGVEVRTSNPANCSWGASGELRSITRFNGNSTVLIDVFTYGQNLQSGAISTWELWEIVS
ncbi:tail fiber protein [Pectobacterium polaris]|uniref:phage tail fiber protein n=1 Tax=Pectobacterium polaris TaxID=2042057 RepID=UPI002405FE69|nr:hypothetical protein [Pectobacterium polaris]MDG0801948.1 hypothetical protein [Pectobacterium polaris]